MDLVKIHIRSGKLTLMTYDGFETQPISMLRERIKINMRQRTVDFFGYFGNEKGYGDYDPQPLCWKSRLIDASFPDYEKQRSFDKRLSGLKIPELAEGHGPSIENLTTLLQIHHRLTIRGYRFFKTQFHSTLIMHGTTKNTDCQNCKIGQESLAIPDSKRSILWTIFRP